MKAQYKAALVRFGRVLLYGVLGVVIAALPDLVTSVPAEYQFIAAPALVAVLAGLDKLRRYGTDPGEARE